ncbi:class I SAM-dependent methyltransferase [Magnetococcales bacterium HHB-1]
MNSNFDYCAKEYVKIYTTILDDLIEYGDIHTTLSLLGPTQNRSVLELGCGNGIYTQQLKRWGAKPIVGVDVSQKMIDLAKEKVPPGDDTIQYLCHDVLTLGEIGQFDLVLMPFLLSLAKTADMHKRMCQVAYQNLKKGGMLIIADDNVFQSPATFDKTKKFGYQKKMIGDSLTPGASIRFTISTETQEITIDETYLPRKTWMQSFTQAGFKEITWHPPIIAPEGIEKYGADYWTDYVDTPFCLFATMIK